MFSYLKGKSPHKRRVEVEQLKETKAVYRDDLTKKQAPIISKAKAVVKKRVRFADSEPTILGSEDSCENEFDQKRSCVGNEFGDKEGIRVKVKMTREEASRFLSRCNGGVLEFKDVARELVSIPVNRVTIL